MRLKKSHSHAAGVSRGGAGGILQGCSVHVLLLVPGSEAQPRESALAHAGLFFSLLRYVCKSGGLRAVLNAVKLWIFFPASFRCGVRKKVRSQGQF